MNELSDDLIVSIVSYNIDHEGTKLLAYLKTINKQFYNALNGNNPSVNMLWKRICLYKFPNTPSSLKMKRWDAFYRYRMKKIIEHRQKDDTFRLFNEADINDSVIINCEHDIEEINNLHSNIFKDKINDNNLPNGFKWNFKCPVVSDKLKYVDKTTKYCDICKKNVYQVTSTEELQERVNNKECVSLTVYSGIMYWPANVLGDVMSYNYERESGKPDPYKKYRDNPDEWESFPIPYSYKNKWG